MKLWVDDVRNPPDGYDYWFKSVDKAREFIIVSEKLIDSILALQSFRPLDESERKIIDSMTVELVDIDHDAGDYAVDGGDYIKLLEWFEYQGFDYPIRIHSMNPVGVENMRRIIQRNGWTEVY